MLSEAAHSASSKIVLDPAFSIEKSTTVNYANTIKKMDRLIHDESTLTISGDNWFWGLTNLDVVVSFFFSYLVDKGKSSPPCCQSNITDTSACEKWKMKKETTEKKSCGGMIHLGGCFFVHFLRHYLAVCVRRNGSVSSTQKELLRVPVFVFVFVIICVAITSLTYQN